MSSTHSSTSPHPLSRFGGDCLQSYDLRRGDKDEVFDYIDLVGEEPLVDEVMEYDARPLIYLLRDFRLTKSQDIDGLCQLLANRGEAAYLGVVEPGRLRLVPCLLEKSSKFETVIQEDDKHAPSLLADLSQGIAHGKLSKAHQQLSKSNLRGRMLEVLKSAGKSIHSCLSNEDIVESTAVQTTLALIGRVLFTRFLFDRKLLSDNHIQDVESSQWFSTPQNTARICAWLDLTFNGELLPLLDKQASNPTKKELLLQYETYFNKLFGGSPLVSSTLYHLFMGSLDDQQYKLFKLLDFAHIPVGLLSEAYEDFAHHFDADTAQATSVHFTPRHIAETIVNQAFDGIRPEDRHTVRLLDPAAGAGVFLIAGFRRLVKEQLRADIPVTTKSIRSLLYDNLRGLDINPHALSLASLALYLTAIELDPNPEPVTKLRFDGRLVGSTLLCIENSLGSLGSSVPASFDNSFDIVIGNPPWTNERSNKPLRTVTQQTALRVLKSRIETLEGVTQEGLQELYSGIEKGDVELTPDFVPDLAFLWRSMEWAKSGGVIAFAIHSRLLFKQTPGNISARDSLFRALRVTGVVNGSDIRQTDVWPSISAPFCLFFARNNVPSLDDSFLYLNPFREKLNKQGRMRLDPTKSHFITIEELESCPTLLKTCFRGTSLDQRVVEKLNDGGGRGALTIEEYWRDKLKLEVGEGYIRGSKGKEDAAWMLELNAKHIERVVPWKNGMINVDELPDFDLIDESTKMHRTCKKELYLPPLLLLWRSFSGKSEKDLGLHLGKTPLVYKERYIGFSAHGHSDSETLLTYIYLLFKSIVSRYYFLMTTSGYGVERESLNTGEIYSLPIVPFSKLSKIEREQGKMLLKRAWSNSEEASIIQADIDTWACKIYGLTKHDQEVMKDGVALFQERAKAEAPPSPSQLNRFVASLIKDVNDLYAFNGLTPKASISNVETPLKAWEFVEIRRSDLAPLSWDQSRLAFFAQCANSEGASEIQLTIKPGHMLIGRLAQQRYWTGSQSRLCGMSLIPKMAEDKESWGLGSKIRDDR